LIAFACVCGVVILGTLVLQFTDAGLKVRAMVDSEALTSLSGLSPTRISICVWMVTTALAGLAGVLAAPANGLTPDGMTALMASAFAAVVAGRLRSLPAAVGVAMGMGILTDVIQRYLPVDSSLTPALLVSIPFMVMGAFLLVYILVSSKVSESASTGGALDNSIRPMGGSDTAKASTSAAVVATRTGWSYYMLGPVVILAIVALLPILFNGYWLTLLTAGLAFSVVFLSYTVVVGEGGMIWLCQASFAGCGAIATAQLATNHGMDPLLAVLIGALIATPIGILIGFAHHQARQPLRRARHFDLRAAGRDPDLHPPHLRQGRDRRAGIAAVLGCRRPILRVSRPRRVHRLVDHRGQPAALHDRPGRRGGALQ
jgi:branched-chain amino acid transport system permease protein